MAYESSAAEDLRMDAGALMGALWSRALRIVIVTILLLVATFVVLMFVPKQYESVASLLIEDRTSTYTAAPSQGLNTTATGTGITIDALMSSQIELIKSRDTLLAVIDSQKLRSVAEFNGSAGNPLSMLLSLVGKSSSPKSIDETVLQNLNERLTVIRERDSAVISVYVRSADPTLAAAIANAIAAEHVRRRAGQSVTDTAEATVFLQQQIDQLRVKVQAADSAVANYKANNNIFAGTNGTSLPDQQMSEIGKQITDAQQLRNAAEQRAGLIRSLVKSGQAVEGVEDVRNSTVVQSLMQSRATLQSTLAEKSATLLPAHPTIVALNAQIEQFNSQIRGEAKRIADGLSAQVTVQDGIIQALNDDLARAKLASSTQTKDTVTLDSLTREANAQRALLDSYLLKYRDAAGRTDAGSVLPDVRIITQAAPSVVPASPKTALILGAVAFVALALQIGMVLFGELMSGRAVYDRRARVAGVEPEVEPEPVAVAEPAAAPVRTMPRAEVAPVAPVAELEDERDLADIAEAPPAPVMAAPAATAVVSSAPEPTPAARHVAAGNAQLEFSTLSADVALGRVRVVLVASIGEGREAAIVADRLVGDAIYKGLSVCRVDAGSGRLSMALGLTDLCADDATFGDVVHKVREGLAEVPWGQRHELDRRSTKPLTLVEALADIYEVVVISTGRIGLNSSLPIFVGLSARLVMVRNGATPPALVEAVSADAASIGFADVQSVLVPELETAVA